MVKVNMSQQNSHKHKQIKSSRNQKQNDWHWHQSAFAEHQDCKQECVRLSCEAKQCNFAVNRKELAHTHGMQNTGYPKLFLLKLLYQPADISAFTGFELDEEIHYDLISPVPRRQGCIDAPASDGLQLLCFVQNTGLCGFAQDWKKSLVGAFFIL